jgi:hypothetical protein
VRVGNDGAGTFWGGLVRFWRPGRAHKTENVNVFFYFAFQEMAFFSFSFVGTKIKLCDVCRTIFCFCEDQDHKKQQKVFREGFRINFFFLVLKIIPQHYQLSHRSLLKV